MVRVVRFVATLSWGLLAAASLTGGAARAASPAAAATSAWGPFARECGHTEVSRTLAVRRGGTALNAETNYEVCTGFSVPPNGDGPAVITASTSAPGRPGPLISRLLRMPDGAVHLAGAGDLGLLALGSDDPATAATVAEEITAPRPAADGTVVLPFTLPFAVPIRGTLSCRPNGDRVFGGRRVRVLSCTLDQVTRDAVLNGQLHLTGEAEIDAATGVRTLVRLDGRLTGQTRFNDATAWQDADYAVRYRSAMELADTQ